MHKKSNNKPLECYKMHTKTCDIQRLLGIENTSIAGYEYRNEYGMTHFEAINNNEIYHYVCNKNELYTYMNGGDITLDIPLDTHYQQVQMRYNSYNLGFCKIIQNGYTLKNQLPRGYKNTDYTHPYGVLDDCYT